MLPQQASRMDMLKAQALAMKLQSSGANGTAPMQQDPYAGIQISNQPVQSMLKPKYSSNMGGSMGRSGLYSSMIRGYSGGVG